MIRKYPWYYFPWLYHVLKHWVRLGTKTYYRKVEQKGKKAYDPKGPKIIAVNHRNGLSDAILIASLLREHPTFLTRADVFLKPLARKALNWLRMIPVYRSRDGVDVIQKNQETFQFCIDELKDGNSVFIFPEGNHARKHRVRPLKKGLARIAFQAAEQSDFTLPLKIVPVGITYSKYIEIYGNLLIWYGTPIDLEPYYPLYKENPRKALLEVTKALREALKEYTLHISLVEEYDFIDQMQKLYTADHLGVKYLDRVSPSAQLKASKEIVEKVEAKLSSDSKAFSEIRGELPYYFEDLERLALRDHVIQRGPFSRQNLFIKGFGIFLLAPFFLISLIHHFWLYRFPYQFAINKFKDDQWHQSISMLFATFPAVPYHLILFGLVWWLTGSAVWATIYISLVIASGLLGLEMIRWWKRWRGDIRYMHLLRTKDSIAIGLAARRKKLVDVIRKNIQTPAPKPLSEGVGN